MVKHDKNLNFVDTILFGTKNNDNINIHQDNNKTELINNYNEINEDAFQNKNFTKTEIGVRPEFIKFDSSGLPVKINKVSNTGRYNVVDTECEGGKLKILSPVTSKIPSGSAFVKFDKKRTFAYGDSWIIE
mgnify:CR=1 FL=1